MTTEARYDSISLATALANIATAFSLSADDLIAYAAEDEFGGYHASYDDGFPVGSMWRVEGQILYALVRALKPRYVLETGTSRGCSATHICAALTANGGGHLDCVDNGSQVSVIGDLIPAQYTGLYQIHQMDMLDFLSTAPDNHYGLYLEDAMHSTEQVETAWRTAQHILHPGGVLLSHDAEHFDVIANFGVGEQVRAGMAQAGYNVIRYGQPSPVAPDTQRAYTVLAHPGNCGFGYWMKPA